MYEKAKDELRKFKKGKLLLHKLDRIECILICEFLEFTNEIEKSIPTIESKLNEMKPKIATEMELRVNRLVRQTISISV